MTNERYDCGLYDLFQLYPNELPLLHRVNYLICKGILFTEGDLRGKDKYAGRASLQTRHWQIIVNCHRFIICLWRILTPERLG
jgi:hypothetical protein